MSGEIRWSIAELQARYELEPNLSDYFVEGVLDREILGQSVKVKEGMALVYEIDVVDVSDTVLKKYGLTSGNKQRVIALSRELESIHLEAKVTCIVDKDLDHWFSSISNSRRLRWTVYSAIECHFLTAATVEDIVVTTCRSKVVEIARYTESLLFVLRQLYALRLADRALGFCLKWTSRRKYLSKIGDSIKFDVEKYTSSLLLTNKKIAQLVDFKRSYNDWLGRLNCDVRLSARGHDYTELLAWSIGCFGGCKELASEAAVERLFVVLARSVPTLADELQ